MGFWDWFSEKEKKAKQKVKAAGQVVKKKLTEPNPTAGKILGVMNEVEDALINHVPKSKISENYTWKQPVRKIASSVADTALNIPSNILQGTAMMKRAGDQKDYKGMAKAGLKAAETGLDIASFMVGGSAGKEAVKQGLKTPLKKSGEATIKGAFKEGFKRNWKSGAQVGLGYGLTQGGQQGESWSEMGKNAAKQGALMGLFGGLSGGLAGGVASGAGAGAKVAVREGKNIIKDAKVLPKGKRTFSIPATTEKISREMVDIQPNMGVFRSTPQGPKKVDGFQMRHKQGPFNYPAEKVTLPFKPESALFQFMQKPKAGLSIDDVTKSQNGKLFRFSDNHNKETYDFRGGTWFTNKADDEVIKQNIEWNPKQIGGKNVSEWSGKFRNPLVIDNAELFDGSFSIVNSGYEKFIDKKSVSLMERLYDVFRGENPLEGQQADTEIMNILYDAGIDEKTARKIFLGGNSFDAAMDLIASKALKKKGYDGLVLRMGDTEHAFAVSKGAFSENIKQPANRQLFDDAGVLPSDSSSIRDWKLNFFKKNGRKGDLNAPVVSPQTLKNEAGQLFLPAPSGKPTLKPETVVKGPE